MIGRRMTAVAMIMAAALAGSAVRAAAPAAPGAPVAGAAKHTFAIGENDFLLDGQKFQIRCGEVHAARVPPEYWRHRLKMAKAMGLNTVCAYLFWNMHEPREGEFNFSGQADVAAFCKIAQEEGLWVILRPGPYACAEWEMGGFPSWLLKDDAGGGVKLRSRDPKFIEPAKRYLKEVGKVMGPLQVTHGGPILMVQVENEYGFYEGPGARDAEYMGEVRQALLDAGFDVPLFACNPTDRLNVAYRKDLFPVVNFGTGPESAFRALRRILPQGPLMCGEFYPGWFDTWGVVHHGKDTPADINRYLEDLTYMLEHGQSFSIYMAHGGTTFGLWSGADRPFKPDTSSYDYGAPITEAGWTNIKFDKTRELFSKHLLPGETLPEPPAANPVIAFGSVKAAEYAPVFANLPEAVADKAPRNMEAYDYGYGAILYRTTLPAGPAGMFQAQNVHDYGYVFLDGKRIGVMDRRINNYKVDVPARAAAARLDVLVETAGRVNFGQEVHDRKGMYGAVKLYAGGQSQELSGWSVYKLPLDKGPAALLKYTAAPATPPEKTPAYWRLSVNLPKAADTFLDVSTWGKGVVWVNGHCMGRFWNIGPTQTMYMPGPWLKEGANEVVVLDFAGPEKAEIAGLEKPVLDTLHPEKDFSRIQRPAVTLGLQGLTPAQSGQFANNTQEQEVKFAAPAKGRYFCIESVNAWDNGPHAAIAELGLLDESGKPMTHEGWLVAYVDSEEHATEDGTAENAIDGQTANYWHSQSTDARPRHPHRLILDLGQSRTLSGFVYTPRQGENANGHIKDYRIYVGDGLVK